MAESEALSRMVAPHQHRPSTPWRGGTIQVMVTRACNEACCNCTQGSQYAGKPVMMTPEEFERAMQSLEGYWGCVGMYGGNSCLHPQFPELCKIMVRYFPQEQRVLFSNDPHGHGKLCRETFHPLYSNCNVHGNQEAYDEFARDWPEIVEAGRAAGIDRLFGLAKDSRHSAVFVAMKDVLVEADTVATPRGLLPGTSSEIRHLTEGERWTLASGCDINQHWSALLGVVPGRGLRAWFCEIAYSLTVARVTNDPDYPDIGIVPFPGWWRLPMTAFAEQARKACHECGVPLRGHGALSQGEGPDQVSETYGHLRPKRVGRRLELVTVRGDLGEKLGSVVDYRGNGGGW